MTSSSDTSRRLRTVLFTDIVGSTDLAAQLGDRRWRALVGRHHQTIRREIKRHRGREVDTAGDGFFATFESPTDGVRCAAAAVAAVHGLGLRIRAGLHTGEVETSDSRSAASPCTSGACWPWPPGGGARLRHAGTPSRARDRSSRTRQSRARVCPASGVSALVLPHLDEAVVKSPPPTGRGPAAVHAADATVWVANVDAGTLTRMRGAMARPRPSAR
jgi:hypothetical protein